MKKDKDKQLQKAGKKETALIRSSATEYLTFVAAAGSSETSVEMRYEDENIWLTQKMTATLYDVTVSVVNQHLKRIYSDNELTREATIKKYLIVQTEGNGQVKDEVDHYSLQAIVAVGFKIENERAVQFRKWANRIVKGLHHSGVDHGCGTTQGWRKRLGQRVFRAPDGDGSGNTALRAQVLSEDYRHLCHRIGL